MAVQLTFEIPDAYVAPTLAAFNAMTGSRMSIEYDGAEPGGRGRWDFVIADKDESETNQAFAKRFIAELVLASVRCVDIAEDEERYRTEISAILPPSQGVPDELIG